MPGTSDVSNNWYQHMKCISCPYSNSWTTNDNDGW